MLEGVPFEPGTHVEVAITPTQLGVQSPAGKDVDRTARLLAALDKARNSETIGPLKRAEIYDRAILAAAKQMGCTTVYSEDLNPGQDYEGVTVVNPFKC